MIEMWLGIAAIVLLVLCAWDIKPDKDTKFPDRHDY